MSGEDAVVGYLSGQDGARDYPLCKSKMQLVQASYIKVFIFFSYNKNLLTELFIDQACLVKMAEHWVQFLGVFMDLDSVSA